MPQKPRNRARQRATHAAARATGMSYQAVATAKTVTPGSVEEGLECIGCGEPEDMPHAGDCPFRDIDLGAAGTVALAHTSNDPYDELERWRGLDAWLMRYANAIRTDLRNRGLTIRLPLFEYVEPEVGESASVDITTADGSVRTFTWYDYSGWCQETGDVYRPDNRGERDSDGYVPAVARISGEIATAVLTGELGWDGPHHIYREPTDPEFFRPLLDRLEQVVEEAERA